MLWSIKEQQARLPSTAGRWQSHGATSGSPAPVVGHAGGRSGPVWGPPSPTPPRELAAPQQHWLALTLTGKEGHQGHEDQAGFHGDVCTRGGEGRANGVRTGQDGSAVRARVRRVRSEPAAGGMVGRHHRRRALLPHAALARGRHAGLGAGPGGAGGRPGCPTHMRARPCGWPSTWRVRRLGRQVCGTCEQSSKGDGIVDRRARALE